MAGRSLLRGGPRGALPVCLWSDGQRHRHGGAGHRDGQGRHARLLRRGGAGPRACRAGDRRDPAGDPCGGGLVGMQPDPLAQRARSRECGRGSLPPARRPPRQRLGLHGADAGDRALRRFGTDARRLRPRHPSQPGRGQDLPARGRAAIHLTSTLQDSRRPRLGRATEPGGSRAGRARAARRRPHGRVGLGRPHGQSPARGALPHHLRAAGRGRAGNRLSRPRPRRGRRRHRDTLGRRRGVLPRRRVRAHRVHQPGHARIGAVR